jgi:hypothetical protein
LVLTVDGSQATWTEVMVEADDCTVTEAEPDFVESCVLVAVTVAVPAEAGAVKTPLVFTVPPLADQVTAELKFPVPFTVALHCDAAFTAMVEGVQVSETEETVGDPEPPPCVLGPPPQATSAARSRKIPSACGNECCRHMLLQ